MNRAIAQIMALAELHISVNPSVDTSSSKLTKDS